MTSKNISVMATYATLRDAENGLNLLRCAGFRSTDHSLLLSINEGTKDLIHVKNSKAPEGTVAGFAAGALTGAVAAWVLTQGSIHVPMLDGFLQAGAGMVVLVGLSIGAAAGGCIGALFGWTVPEYEAKLCSGHHRHGAILLSVHCDNTQWRNEAVALLRSAGAEDIGWVTEAPADFASTHKPLPRAIEHERIA